MKANLNTESKTYESIPNFWNNTFGYDKLIHEIHYNDGWRDVVIPEKTEHQGLGDLYFDEENDVFTYHIIDFTQEEIELYEDQKLLAPTLEEQSRYVQRMQDGKDAYALQSAKLRLAKLSGAIDESTHNVIEDMLIPVRDEVVNGQWMTAKEKLEDIGSDGIGEDLYNDLHTQIVNYINDSYKIEND